MKIDFCHAGDCRDSIRQIFRPEGARWNARTCTVGRPVVYGKTRRMNGIVVGYRKCYGDKGGIAACIRI